MKFDFAPMEGVTGYPFRNAHHALFPGMDAYYAPFIELNPAMRLKKRERRDLLPEIAESCFISEGAFRQLTHDEILEIYEEVW